MNRNGYRWVCICLIASKHQRNSKGVENGNLHFSRFDQIFAFDDSNCYSDQHCTFSEYIRQQQQTTFFKKLEYILWLQQLTTAKWSSVWKCWLLLWTSLSAEHIRVENWNALSKPSINLFLHLRHPRVMMLWSFNFFTFYAGRNFPKVRYWATPTARWQI